MKNHSSQDTTLDISIIGLMSALVFVGTYFFKIPSAFGYTHLGDCMIIQTGCQRIQLLFMHREAADKALVHLYLRVLQ